MTESRLRKTKLPGCERVDLDFFSCLLYIICVFSFAKFNKLVLYLVCSRIVGSQKCFSVGLCRRFPVTSASVINVCELVRSDICICGGGSVWWVCRGRFLITEE